MIVQSSVVLQEPSALLRTTLGEFLSNGGYTGAGVYVIACYPSLSCVYVGISNNIYSRLRQHLSHVKPMADFIRMNMADACGWRLDILIPPNEDDTEWCRQVELELVRMYRPLFNTHGLSD